MIEMADVNDFLASFSGGTPSPPPTPSPASFHVPTPTAEEAETAEEMAQAAGVVIPEPPPPQFSDDVPQREPQFEDVPDDEPEPGIEDEPEPEPVIKPNPWASYSPVVNPDPDAAGKDALYDDGGIVTNTDDIRPSTSGGKSALVASMLDKPKAVFAQHPTWKRPALFGAVGLAVAMVIAVMFGGSPATETPKTAPAPPPVAQETAEQAPDKQVTTLMPKAVSASCPAGSTRAQLAFSSRPEDAWRCFRAHGIDGAILNIKFANNMLVKSVTLMPGWNYVEPNGTDHWNESRLVTRILWRLGGKQFVQNINPTRAGSTFTFPGQGVVTQDMSLTVQASVPPESVKSDEPVNGTGILPPPPAGGDAHTPDKDEVNKWIALSKITITGTDLG